VREKSIAPRAEFRVRWSEAEFPAATFEERFELVESSARPVAFFEDRSPAAYESSYGRGRAILLGAFAGHMNETKPVEMHPLGEILARWAGLTRPQLTSSAQVELKLLHAPNGSLVFLFNHGSQPANVEYAPKFEKTARQIRELVTGRCIQPSAGQFTVRAQLPPQSARVYRIDF
jgi:hypothetical protein